MHLPRITPMNTNQKRRESRVESREPASQRFQSPVRNLPLNSRHSTLDSCFTLVELLVVIVIIGLLAGMGLTAMQHIGRAQALNSGARQFANDLTMARQYAVVNSTYLYLVVATTNTVTNSTDYAYTAYGFCVPVQVNNVYTQALNSTVNVKYIEDIRYLPRGVVFGTNTSGISSSSISFPADGSNTTSAWVVTFTPNGQVLPISIRPSFYLYEGALNSSRLPFRTSSSTNFYSVEINPLIGKPIVSRYP